MDRERRRERIARHPNAVAYRELAQLLTAYGFEERPSRGGTSHHYFVRGPLQVSVPFKRPHLLPIYVRRVLKLVEQIDQETDIG